MIDSNTIDIIMENEPLKSLPGEMSKRALEALEGQDFSSFMVFFDNTQQLEAFFLIKHLITDENELVELFKEAWSHAEVNHKHLEQTKEFFTEYANVIMNKEEKEIYNALPAKVKIYRGTRVPPMIDTGISWTLDKEIAKKFASYPAGIFHERALDGQDKIFTPNILVKTVSKNKIVCYLDYRDEKEIIYWN